MHKRKYITAKNSQAINSARNDKLRRQALTVLPRRNAAPAPIVAPMESATNPTGKPNK